MSNKSEGNAENPKEVLIALRKIVRAIDLHSKQLNKEVGLTAPQLQVLLILDDHGQLPMGDLARQMSLSQATITSILDRLEKRAFITRQRDDADKRRVFARLTAKGTQAVDTAPKPLQVSFIEQFLALEDWEQNLIISNLQRVASMMNASTLDAAPLLHVGAPDQPRQPAPILATPPPSSATQK